MPIVRDSDTYWQLINRHVIGHLLENPVTIETLCQTTGPDLNPDSGMSKCPANALAGYPVTVNPDNIAAGC